MKLILGCFIIILNYELINTQKRQYIYIVIMFCASNWGIIINKASCNSYMHFQQLYTQSNLIKPTQNSSKFGSSIFQHQNSSVKQCRICLSQNHQSENLFLSPCRCSGSIKYVHHTCLKQWVELKLFQITQTENCQTSVICQLCKTSIFYQIKQESVWRRFSQIKQEIKIKHYQFAVNLICFIVSLFLIAFSLFQLSKIINEGFQNTESSLKIAFSITLLISLATFIYSIYCFKEFFIKKRMQLILQSRQE